MTSESKQTFGRYQIVDEIGAGAMGAVYLARDTQLHRQVAVKALRIENLPEYAAAMSSARFANEARAVAALRHPHIVQVFDMGVEDEVPYIVMEVAQGASLKEHIRSGSALPLALIATVGCHIAQALEAAHRSAIIHRDVKPANILEVEPGVWKLADFGIARIPESTLTLPGQFVGTPAYAAPEAIQIGQSTSETDVYSLGATLYEACVGTPPYGNGGLMTPGALDEERPPEGICARRPDVPPAVEDIILRAVAREPAARPQPADIAAVLSAYQAAQLALPPATGGLRRGQKIALGVALVGALIIGVLLGSSDDDEAAAPDTGASMWNRSEPSTAPSPDRGYADDPRYQREWNKILDKLDEGKYRDAEKRLHKFLRKYPDDPNALNLLDQLQE